MFFLKMYQALVWGIKPIILWIIKQRLDKGKEDPQRIQERYGRASISRPEGPLIWIHAASVGESRSILVLVEQILHHYPEIHVLVTTHTITSAKMMKKLLPARAIHQYIPYDRAAWVRHFLEHWRPSLVLWAESELWPTFLTSLGQRNIPILLVNGRLSQSAFQKWSRIKPFARLVMRQFQCCLVQSLEDKERFSKLGGKHIQVTGNIKYSARPLNVNQEEGQKLKIALNGRAIWLAASTHPGEEEEIIKAQIELRHSGTQALCIIVPRHPERAEEICNLLKKNALTFAQRSQVQIPDSLTEVYLADTLGELGVFYDLAPIAFVGGSLVPIGGHNLIEAAQLDCAILHGPFMHKSQDMAQEFSQDHAAISVNSWQDLAVQVADLMHKTDLQENYAKAAKALVEKRAGMADGVMQQVIQRIGQAQGEETHYAESA